MHRILIVDDDKLVRGTLRAAMQRAGYDVIEARHGGEAARLMRDPSIDLLVTDLIMPEHDGLETIIQTRKQRPDLPIIAMSGGGQTKNLEFLRYAKQFGANRVLSKPFPISWLESSVRELLAAAKAVPAAGDPKPA